MKTLHHDLVQSVVIVATMPEIFADQAAELDRCTLNGLWSVDQYCQEIQRQSGSFLGLFERQFLVNVPNKNSLGAPDHYSLDLRTTSLIGMACCWEILDEAHITLLAIAPHRQRQGLGHLLLNRLLLEACNRGLARATLEVRKTNQAALILYESNHFKIAGERKHYYTDGETGVILWLSGLQRRSYQEFLAQQWDRRTERMRQEGLMIRDQRSLNNVTDTESRP